MVGGRSCISRKIFFERERESEGGVRERGRVRESKGERERGRARG